MHVQRLLNAVLCPELPALFRLGLEFGDDFGEPNYSAILFGAEIMNILFSVRLKSEDKSSISRAEPEFQWWCLDDDFDTPLGPFVPTKCNFVQCIDCSSRPQ